MSEDDLLQTLQALEVELHRTETRRELARLDALLHPDFEEYGRSGRRYSRAEILDAFQANGDLTPIVAWDFALARLGDELGLLTYKSAHVGPSGDLYRHTLRSSLWVHTATGWQMRFHQGTPTDQFQELAT